jgi:hypothetical protein
MSTRRAIVEIAIAFLCASIVMLAGSAPFLACSASADKSAAAALAALEPLCGTLDAIPVGGAIASVACAAVDPAIVAGLDAAAASASVSDAGAPRTATHRPHVRLPASPLPLATRLAAVCPGATQHVVGGVGVAAWTCVASAPPGHYAAVQAVLGVVDGGVEGGR